MRLAIVMDNLGEAFTRNIQPVWDVVITGRENDFFGTVTVLLASMSFCANNKVAVGAIEFQDALVLMDMETVVIGDAPIIFERFRPSRLLIERRHGNVANLQQFRRGEENKIGRVMINGIDYAALIK